MNSDVLHSVAFFVFEDTAPTEIYTLSLHDALPISVKLRTRLEGLLSNVPVGSLDNARYLALSSEPTRSEEHTSELQSHVNLVCRLLLEKKKNKKRRTSYPPQNYRHLSP